MTRLREFLKRYLPYVLVAVLASAATWLAADLLPTSKLDRLSAAIERKYIGEADSVAMQDAAAEAMIASLGDRWSYYISAEEYAAHLDRQSNSYVGIGVTIQGRQDKLGFDIIAVTAGGPAEEAGILPGDILTHADGTAVGELTTTEVRGLVMGEKNTKVMLTLLRGEETLELSVTRKVVHSQVATGLMLTEDVGYISISNFHTGAGEETIGQVEKLLEEGAEKIVFDVRNNPGGYVHEMVEALDYLLPEGPLFRSVSYNGKEDVDESDADCLEIPMAVLINGNTYSAAEFFAAALVEYDWAVSVGEPTTGKGYYQTTIELGDGSAVQLSTGAYTTPKGVNLTEAGGLQPQVPVMPADAVSGLLEDPQIMAAVEVFAQ